MSADIDPKKFVVQTRAALDRVDAATRDEFARQPLRLMIETYEDFKEELHVEHEKAVADIARKHPALVAILVVNGLAHQIQRRLEDGETP